MDKKLTSFCRYYKGGNKPMATHPTLWEYEKNWVEMNGNDEGRELLAEYIDEFSKAGLSTFEMQDDTPASLKALLFNRFCYWNSGSLLDCSEPFKKWYNKIYIKGGI